jgi:sulfate transport system permease protein
VEPSSIARDDKVDLRVPHTPSPTLPHEAVRLMTALALPRLRQPSVLPGFSLALGLAVTALSLVVLIPLAGLIFKAAQVGPGEFLRIALDPRTLAALRLSFGAAFAAAVVNGVFGLLVAWVLVRYRFPGRRLLDAAVDLPFALPTAVAGIALTAIYAPNGWIGGLLAPLGIKIAYTPLGVIMALIFVGLPFVVRTVQPVLAETEREIEEASALLGASRIRTVFRVVLPAVMPALMTGFALAFARGVGEYGSVIFIAGNIPFVSEIAPLLIVIRLEEFDYAGATVVATVMLAISFSLLLVINLLQSRARRRLGHA